MDHEENARLNYCFNCMRRLGEDETLCPDCGYDNSRRQNPENTLPEGTILAGKYFVGKMLGHGGFGITYLGRDLALDVPVAIKEYFPVGVGIRSPHSIRVTSISTAVDPEGFRKGCDEFQSEAQTLARFNSPNIVHVRDYFRENGTAYIIMDYVRGNSLTKEVEVNGGKIPWERVISLFKPLILELDKLHKQHVIHRDIKPDNLRIAVDESGAERLVLLDFGAARSFLSAQVTKTYTAMVTPGYAPLEQYSPKSRQGPYTDVYALCATMYAAISGVVPAVATDRVVGEADLDNFRSFDLAVPETVEAAITHGLAVKSADRPQSMAELYKELTGEGTPGAVEKPADPVPTVQRDWNKVKRVDDLPERPEPKKSGKIWLLVPLLLILAAGGFSIFRNLQQNQKNTASTQTAVFLTDQQNTREIETKTAVDAENTTAAQQKLTEAAQKVLFAEQTQTQGALDEERPATTWMETVESQLQMTQTQSARDLNSTRTVQAGEMQQTVQVETQSSLQTQEALQAKQTATAWFAAEEAKLNQTQTQSAFDVQNTQTTAAEQTAQAKGTAAALERTREAELHLTETQAAMDAQRTQEAQAQQTAQAERTAAAWKGTQDAMFGLQTEIAGTQDAFHATETMSVMNLTQDAMNLLRTEMAQTQVAFSAMQTQAARPTATSTKTPQPTTTNTLRPSATTAPSLTPTASGPFLYTVQEGDNCWSIIVEFGVPLDVFLIINNLPLSCPIEIGQELLIPAPDQEMPTATPIPLDQYTIGQQIEYTVEINDTYPEIASKFNTTLDSIQRLNDIEDITSFPTFGQTLIIAVNLVTPTPSPVPTYTEIPMDVRVGDIITFGKYEQDNDLSNGPEPIEWQVLDVENGRALLISKYGLDNKPYNEKSESVTWETSTLRKWLNGEFYVDTFNDNEKEAVLQVLSDNPDNSDYKTKSGSNTWDRIFLLNIDDVNKYFPSAESRKCLSTAYAKENGASVNKEYSTSWWWLRSPGYSNGQAAYVGTLGSVSSYGDNVDLNDAVVRPAFWLDLKNGEVSKASHLTDGISQSANAPVPTFAAPQVGDIITFGRYEQDNNLDNGPEPFEWQVLDVENDRALVISRYGLDTKTYNEKYKEVTWETSTLRKWLNGEFYNSAFSQSEQREIREVTNENLSNPKYGTKGGNRTQDKIFLLSINEVNKNFTSNEARKCWATEYAKENGAYIYNLYYTSWWLRSPGYNRGTAVIVDTFGEVKTIGTSVDNTSVVVRPAFWMNL